MTQLCWQIVSPRIQHCRTVSVYVIDFGSVRVCRLGKPPMQLFSLLRHGKPCLR